jgi:CDP-glucose 4,6-dehydratase
VEAYLLLAEKLSEDQIAGQAFNFGNETPLSVMDVVRRILSSMGQTSLQPVILNEASNEIPRQYLDCSKAQRLLGWKPVFSVEQGLQETIAWYEEHLGVREMAVEA